MFGRSRSGNKAHGHGLGGARSLVRDLRAKDIHVANLLDTGLVGHPPLQRPSSRAETTRSHESGTSRAATDVIPYSEKNYYSTKSSSVRGGSSNRPKTSTSSVRTGDSTGRMVGSIHNNVMETATGRGRDRRERTFVGSECAVCEEPLEHTLRGERVLQFQCSHVSHEACFYEFIKEFESQYCPACNAPLHLDTSRGGNVLDIEKISSIVRGADVRMQQGMAGPPVPGQWDGHAIGGQDLVDPHARHVVRERASGHSVAVADGQSADRYSATRHHRSDSDATGLTAVTSSAGYAETTQSGPVRHHDYDLQAMETTPASSRPVSRNPIPAPIVTVRSEFPTINRSRHQQTLTCLVTIEVPDSKWRANLEDFGPGTTSTPSLNGRIEEAAQMQQQQQQQQHQHRQQHQQHPHDHLGSSPSRSVPRFYPYEPIAVLEEMTESLRNRVDNWHGLDFSRFGKLRLYGTLRVGKDKVSWQELECFLFADMLICVKEKKAPSQSSQHWDENGPSRKKCTLKGSILIRKHLNDVSETGSIDDNVLTLGLSVTELPYFHLRFDNRNQLKLWKQALLDLHAVEDPLARSPELERGDFSETDEDVDWGRGGKPARVASLASSQWTAAKSATTAPTEYTSAHAKNAGPSPSVHVPVDVVVVVPISSPMQGVKINLVRDALKFMVNMLGDRDRMGLVTFGSGGGGVPLVGMTTKAWPGWGSVLSSIRPVGQKSHRADVVEGANVAMDLLMQRRHNNPIATIMLISDASTSDADSVDFVVSRAEAAKITIHSFGLGMAHKPDTMIEMSTRTKASYTYVKDWMMLRECLAGCLGAMQTLSHQNAKLKLKLPEGSVAKFHKISGALQITKRAAGRDAEASLGDLRFGDKRDILVQLVILPDSSTQEQLPQDPWDNIVSGLEALGGPVDQEDSRTVSVEEVPLVQADLNWGDILRDGTVNHLPRPSLLAITMLPGSSPSTSSSSQKKSWGNTPPIPPHPNIVQRRMELLTSDMLTRALTLVGRGQHDRAHTLLNETRSILKGLGKGGLPPVPANKSSVPSTPHPGGDVSPAVGTPDRRRTPSPTSAASSSATIINQAAGGSGLGHSRSADGLTTGLGSGIDPDTVAALDAELESSLEWICHPAVFGRDSRKAVLQTIGVISSQRAYTARTPIEAIWASRVSGVKRLTEKSREWREEGGGEHGIMEEA